MTDNNSDYSDLHHQKKDHDIVIEDLASITHIFQISINAVLKSLPLLIPFFLMNLLATGYVAFKTRVSIDLPEFMEVYGTQNQEYINNIADQVSDILILSIGSTFVLFFLSTLIYSSIAHSRNADSTQKMTVLYNMFITRGAPLFLAMLLKSIIIAIGMFLFIIPGVMAWLALMFVEYIVIFEKKGFIEACVRSNEMMKGVKSNFLTFVSMASLAIVPVLIFKVFYNFEIESSSVIMGGAIDHKLFIAGLVESAKYGLYGIYFVGTCLLYFKRKSI